MSHLLLSMPYFSLYLMTDALMGHRGLQLAFSTWEETITVLYGVTITSWPLLELLNPSDFKTIHQTTAVYSAVLTKLCSLCILNQDKWNKVRARYPNPQGKTKKKGRGPAQNSAEDPQARAPSPAPSISAPSPHVPSHVQSHMTSHAPSPVPSHAPSPVPSRTPSPVSLHTLSYSMCHLVCHLVHHLVCHLLSHFMHHLQFCLTCHLMCHLACHPMRCPMPHLLCHPACNHAYHLTHCPFVENFLSSGYVCLLGVGHPPCRSLHWMKNHRFIRHHQVSQATCLLPTSFTHQPHQPC